jgi:hypothetical protein
MSAATDTTLIPLAEVVRHMPPGVAPSPSTLLRWATVGCRGQRLQAQRVGGRLYTTVAAVKAFLDALNGVGRPADVANALQVDQVEPAQQLAHGDGLALRHPSPLL